MAACHLLARSWVVSPKRPRQLLVALHVLTSVGWLTMALAQITLITHGITTTDPQTRRAALTMTEFVDHEILRQAATGSAYTGLMLSALTSWGFFRFTWVAVKFSITIGGLYLGIWHLSSWLEQGVRASETGEVGPVGYSVFWGSALIAAMVFATWLSVAKPWGRMSLTRRGSPGRLTRPDREPAAHPLVWVGALFVPFIDCFAHLQGGPSLLTVLGYAGYRGVRSRSRRPVVKRAYVCAVTDAGPGDGLASVVDVSRTERNSIMAATSGFSPTMTAFPTRLAAGVAGGLAGGVVFGILMQLMGMMPMVAMLVGAESTAVGWVVHLVISAFIGVTYALIFARWADRLPIGAVLGIGYGVVWWVLGALLIMPARLGVDVFTFTTMAWQSLLGHLLFGLVLGVGYALVQPRLRQV